MVTIGDENCPVKDNCRNYDERCLYCSDKSQYKPYKKVKGLSRTPSKKKKGMDFEEKCRVKYDNHMAKRMPLSGGIEGMEGDISFQEVLAECKERGTKDSRGKKSISIKKEWLDKIFKEAKRNDRLPALLFGYKDSDEIYFAMEYEWLLDLLLKMKYYKQKMQKLEKKLQQEE